MEMAAALLAVSPRTPLRRVGDTVFGLWITAPVAVYAFRQEWGWMAFAAAWPLLVGVFVIYSRRFRERAAEALDANRSIRPPKEPAPRVVADSPSLAVGLPKSVARARRMREHPPPT